MSHRLIPTLYLTSSHAHHNIHTLLISCCPLLITFNGSSYIHNITLTYIEWHIEPTLSVVQRHTLHRCFLSPWLSIHSASSLVLWAPVSFLSTFTIITVGRPLDQCPYVGLLAGSSWCLWQWPASLILLAGTWLLTLHTASIHPFVLPTCPWAQGHGD